jgi:hypothetical protein
LWVFAGEIGETGRRVLGRGEVIGNRRRQRMAMVGVDSEVHTCNACTIMRCIL